MATHPLWSLDYADTELETLILEVAIMKDEAKELARAAGAA
jgi:hypothetical protein